MAFGILADATTLTAGLVAVTAVAGGAAWFALRLRTPDRTLRAARRAIDRGDLDVALALLTKIRPDPAGPPKPWHAEQKHLEAECLYAAAETALRDRRFADALDHYKAVAVLVGMEESEASRRVVEAMLAEARRLSAAAPDGPALSVLLALILERQSPCPEASFWLAMYHLRHKETAAGIQALEAAHAATEGRQIDPCLYLGAVWLREGKPREALRVLAEANRIAPGCPLVSWHLGMALVESGGDALLALRALQKATAADGLPKFLRSPQRLWADTLPAESWVRNLAQRSASHRTEFRCPLGLDQVEPIYQRARLALAETLVTCDRAEESVPIFTDLLKTLDHPAVRRGLGLALTQLGEWDRALPHLRNAYAAERPATPATTGALAVCLVHAAGDRVTNIRQALGLIGAHNVLADAAWARRAGAVFAAAQGAGVKVSPAVVAGLADVLASTDAADPTAASVYDLLAALKPGAVPLVCAHLYVRAAQRHGVNLAHDEQLFDLAMTDRGALRALFTAREWDFEAVERLYLERWADRHPGTFPTAPGPSYPAQAEAVLLGDARRLASQNRPEKARDVAGLLLRLHPTAGPVHDLVAELAYRRGDRAEAAEKLKAWHAACPKDPMPLARLAALAAADHRPGEALAIARKALSRVDGPASVQYLLLAARLALAAGKPADAVGFFDDCQDVSPDYPVALAGQAALAWTHGDFAKLASLADRMAAVPAEDPWYHYLAGAASLLAGHLREAEVSAKHAAADPATAAEGRHLLALVRDRRNDAAGAANLLRDAAVANGAAAEHAVALRGQAAWRGGNYAEALRCWKDLPEARLKTWNLSSLMGGTAFLAGVQALRAGDADDAANWLRQATRLGHADPRLDSLLTIACTRAEKPGSKLELLEKAVDAGARRPELTGRLARAYRHAGKLASAQRLLEQAAAEDVLLSVERGLLAISQGQLLVAEKAFAAAWTLDPQSPAAAVNLLFTRLSLGRLAEAVELMPRAADLAPTPPLKRLLGQLHALATDNPSLSRAGGKGTGSESSSAVQTAGPNSGASSASRARGDNSDWTIEDDRAIVNCLRSIGRLESVGPLFHALRARRGQSEIVRQAETELAPLLAKDRLDRGDPAGAAELLKPHDGSYGRPLVRNLLGICACLHQDFQRAVRKFQTALPPVGDDARVQQNLALVRGWLGDAERSGAHWRRFLELQTVQMSAPPGSPDYHRQIEAVVRDALRESDEELVGPRSGIR